MDADLERLSADLARLSGAVAAIGGILASMSETAKVDMRNALKIADATLGARASAETSREAKRVIERIVGQAKKA